MFDQNEFMKSFMEQSIEAANNPTSKRAPEIEPLILGTAVPSTAVTTVVAPPTQQVYSHPTTATVSNTQHPNLVAAQPQKFSEYRPVGTAPKDWAPSNSCSNCEYFCGWGSGYCKAFDFPTVSAYVCGNFELISNEKSEYFADVTAPAPITPAPDVVVQPVLPEDTILPAKEIPTGSFGFPQPPEDPNATEEDRTALARYNNGESIGVKSLSRLRMLGLIPANELPSVVVTVGEPVATPAFAPLGQSFSDATGFLKPTNETLYELSKGVVSKDGAALAQSSINAVYQSLYDSLYKGSNAFVFAEGINTQILSDVITEAKTKYKEFPTSTTDSWVKLQYKKRMVPHVTV